ncbi:hypothetical protein ONZ45_g14183 [Pleurotus djamor]|nr:hypothetical protein ONZ45_g14183 [Pleurotus djamor]
MTFALKNIVTKIATNKPTRSYKGPVAVGQLEIRLSPTQSIVDTWVEDASISFGGPMPGGSSIRDGGFECGMCGRESRIRCGSNKKERLLPSNCKSATPSRLLKTQSYEDDLGELFSEFDNIAFSGSLVRKNTTTIDLLQMRYDTMVEQGANAESIWSQSRAHSKHEEAIAEHEEELKGDGGFITTGSVNVKSVAL